MNRRKTPKSIPKPTHITEPELVIIAKKVLDNLFSKPNFYFEPYQTILETFRADVAKCIAQQTRIRRYKHENVRDYILRVTASLTPIQTPLTPTTNPLFMIKLELFDSTKPDPKDNTIVRWGGAYIQAYQETYHWSQSRENATKFASYTHARKFCKHHNIKLSN